MVKMACGRVFAFVTGLEILKSHIILPQMILKSHRIYAIILLKSHKFKV